MSPVLPWGQGQAAPSRPAHDPPPSWWVHATTLHLQLKHARLQQVPYAVDRHRPSDRLGILHVCCDRGIQSRPTETTSDDDGPAECRHAQSDQGRDNVRSDIFPARRFPQPTFSWPKFLSRALSSTAIRAKAMCTCRCGVQLRRAFANRGRHILPRASELAIWSLAAVLLALSFENKVSVLDNAHCHNRCPEERNENSAVWMLATKSALHTTGRTPTGDGGESNER